jgi:hypothetical protein
MLKSFCLCLSILIFSAVSPAQAPGAEFGCSGRSKFFENVDLHFIPLVNPQSIRAWENRPGTTFDGFDEQKFGFSSVVIYGWRAPLRDKEHKTTGHFVITVRTAGARGEHWFQISAPSRGSVAEKLLYIDRPVNADEQPSDEEDDKEDPVTIVSATPDSTLPIFVLAFNYQDTSDYASGTVSNHLLLDLRTGAPRIEKAVQCTQWESAGVCGDPVNSSSVYDNLRCNWDSEVADFRCTLTKPFGPATAVLAATRDFYLLSGNTARPAWYTSETPADLGALAKRIGDTPVDAATMVPQVGMATLLGRYKDLLPDAEVLIFASPGAGESASSAFSFVIVPAQGAAVVQSIPTINISGQIVAQTVALPGFTPAGANDRYNIFALEDRAGFHAFQAVLSFAPAAADVGGQSPVHVLYWVGLEAAQGKIVASAVRVATEARIPGACGQDLHESAAISMEPQQGMAAATVHVRPRELPTTRQNVQQPVCVSIGALYWKEGTGFVIQNTSQDCNEPVPEISITEDGQITARTQENPPQ